MTKLKISQSDQGYRYSLDPFLLSYFATKTAEKVQVKQIIDLGTGNGIIPLCLYKLFPEAKISGIELQKNLARHAQKNVEENNLSEKIRIVEGDIRKIKSHFGKEEFDLVLSNPPYRKVKTGRISPDPERAISRHELALTLEDLIRATEYLLKDYGTIKLIYHPSRLQELIFLMDKYSLKIDYLQAVHSKIDLEAKMILASGIKNGRQDLIILPPIIVYGEDGEYSAEMKNIYAPHHNN